jgi:two-component sensor histidine kinase
MIRQMIDQRWDVDRSSHASRTARGLITSTLDTHVSPATVRDAALLTSELVSNVIRHTDGACVLALRFDPADGCVHIGVTDDEPDRRAEVVERHARTEGGFGLRLVQAIASRWGATHRPDSKTVWFQIGDPVPR